MNISLILELAAEAMPDRVAVGRRGPAGVTYRDLLARARCFAATLASLPDGNVVLLDVNSPAVHISLFGAALAGRSFLPLNYRLEDAMLRDLGVRAAPAVVVLGEGMRGRIDDLPGLILVDAATVVEGVERDPGDALAEPDPDAVAAMLFTSRTTGTPKASILRHRHLTSYVLSTVGLMSADESEASLISVPSYHVASIAAALTGCFAGRRAVLLESFEPDSWISTARSEEITHAMVVPTMLARIVDRLEASGEVLPSLRHLSSGGGPMPRQVIERALRLLPEVDFVNAYGLTETSSTIAVLGPEDHRQALDSDDLAVRARLSSVGRPLPSLEVSVRDALGSEVGVGERGEIWVRGEQVSGEYEGASSDDDWFRTRDEGHRDEDGYLFVHGRLDDVIVRGGENLSPGEIEAVPAQHPAVAAAAVFGAPDEEWGEREMAAVVLRPGATVPEVERRDHVRATLRSTKTPERIEVLDGLPFTETGELLRRVRREQLGARA